MKRKNLKLALSKETLRHIGAGAKDLGVDFAAGTGTCNTCFFSCGEPCDTNFQCKD